MITVIEILCCMFILTTVLDLRLTLKINLVLKISDKFHYSIIYYRLYKGNFDHIKISVVFIEDV